MNPQTTSAFDLPDRLTPKADPALIGPDDAHFAAIAETLAQTTAELSDRLDAARRRPAAPDRPPWTATRRSTGSLPACAP